MVGSLLTILYHLTSAVTGLEMAIISARYSYLEKGVGPANEMRTDTFFEETTFARPVVCPGAAIHGNKIALMEDEVHVSHKQLLFCVDPVE
jgi:hypothetical protein